METVFAEMGAQITSEVFKPKRSAFVFITAESPDSCHGALEDLRKMAEIEEVYLSRGAYDLVAKVKGDSLDQLREIINKRIRNNSSIKSTLTLTVI